MPDEQPASSPSSYGRLQVMLRGYELTQMLHAFVALGIADALSSGPKDATELALELQVNAALLHRLLRALAGLGILRSESDGRFALRPTGKSLLRDVSGSPRSHALAFGTDWWWGAWGRLSDSIRTGTPGFELANGEPAYGFFAQNPEAARIFSDYMYAATSEEADAILEAFDFSSTRVLVDVGGGQGALAHAVLEAFPTTRAILVDVPRVAEWAKLRSAERGLAERIDAMPSDIFRSIPTDGDTYVIQNVLHDWPDEAAMAILQASRRAMEPSARLVVIGYPLDGPRDRSPMIDLRLMVLTGGGERSLPEYRRLIEAAMFEVLETTEARSGAALIVARPVTSA